MTGHSFWKAPRWRRELWAYETSALRLENEEILREATRRFT